MIQNILSIDSAEKAYWLGFFMADGACWPNGKQASIQLSAKDADHLQKFADFVGYPMRLNESNGYSYARVIINSKSFVDDFLRMTGGIRIKSQLDDIAADSTFSRLEGKYMADFMRGMFDGDGSIGKYNGEWRFTLAGEKPMLENFSENLAAYLDIHTRKPYASSGCWRLDVGGINRLSQIRSFFYYSDEVVCLERKRDKWQEMPSHRGTSKYPGVHWDSNRKKWIARAESIHGKMSKSFDDEDEAGIWRMGMSDVITLDSEFFADFKKDLALKQSE